MNILGIACYYHDASACLLKDGVVVRAANQERFSRIKHDANFPKEGIEYCLAENSDPIDAVAFYDNPFLKKMRNLEAARVFGAGAAESISASLSNWWKGEAISREIQNLLGWSREECGEKLHFVEHHLSHAASAFYCSNFPSAAILTLDGVGESATTTIGHGTEKGIELLRQINYPHSLGLLYSAFTHFLGFKVNSGEYKVMGLAPLGTPAYKDLLLKEVITLHDDGSYTLNLKYFQFHLRENMTDEKALEHLLNIPLRQASDPLEQTHKDLAASIQAVVEDAFENLAREALRLTGETRLCLAGGVALNCSAVGKLQRKKIWSESFTQPAAGDAGGSMGAALELNHRLRPFPKTQNKFSVYLGPSIDGTGAKKYFIEKGYPFEEFSTPELIQKVAGYLSEGLYVGWCRGRMEWGPRALGTRSILASPLKPGVQRELNLRIKKRESFRPFAPMVIEEAAREIFEHTVPTPHMTCVYFLKEELRKAEASLSWKSQVLDSESFLHLKAAVIHKDWTARLQTVSESDHPEISRLLANFFEKTSCPMLVNTSFNVRGEPIVCDHIDAYRCFMRAELDVLVVDNVVLFRGKQPPLEVSAIEIFEDD